MSRSPHPRRVQPNPGPRERRASRSQAGLWRALRRLDDLSGSHLTAIRSLAASGARISPGLALTSIRPGLIRTGSPRVGSPRAGEPRCARAAIARGPRHDPWPAAVGRSENLDAAGAHVAAGKRRDDGETARARREPARIDQRQGVGEAKGGSLQTGRLVQKRLRFAVHFGRHAVESGEGRIHVHPVRSRARTAARVLGPKRICGGRSPR